MEPGSTVAVNESENKGISSLEVIGKVERLAMTVLSLRCVHVFANSMSRSYDG